MPELATLVVDWKRPLASLFVLVLGLEGGVAKPLLIGVGIGAVVHRLATPTPTADDAGQTAAASSSRSSG